MSQSFTINGKTYKSVEEMPPEVRAQFESVANLLGDKNQNCVPDMMENVMRAGTMVMQTGKIFFEGKQYDSAEELPPEARNKYEQAMSKLKDENKDGVPDVLENVLPMGTTTLQTNKIVFDGKMYDSPEQLPPEAREKYEQAMSKLADENKNGVPDVLENVMPTPTVITEQFSAGAPQRTRQTTTATSNMGPMVVLGIVCVVLAIGFAILLFLLLGRAGR